MSTKRYRARMRPSNTQSVNDRNPAGEKGIGKFPFRSFKVTFNSTVLPAGSLREAAAIVEALQSGQTLPENEDSVFNPSVAATAMVRGMSESEIKLDTATRLKWFMGLRRKMPNEKELTR